MRRRDTALLRLLHFEYDCCSLCGSTQRLHLHHVLFKSHGGDDVRANLLMLCQQCHDGYHLKRWDGFGERLARHVQEHRPDTGSYLTERLGEGGFTEWLLRHGIT